MNRTMLILLAGLLVFGATDVTAQENGTMDDGAMEGDTHDDKAAFNYTPVIVTIVSVALVLALAKYGP